MRGYKRRVDSNQKEIVNDLRKLGFSVFITKTLTKDFPDLVIGRNRITALVEIKSEEGGLSEGQEKFRKEWKGSQIIVAKTTEDVLTAFELLEVYVLKLESR